MTRGGVWESKPSFKFFVLILRDMNTKIESGLFVSTVCFLPLHLNCKNILGLFLDMISPLGEFRAARNVSDNSDFRGSSKRTSFKPNK